MKQLLKGEQKINKMAEQKRMHLDIRPAHSVEKKSNNKITVSNETTFAVTK